MPSAVGHNVAARARKPKVVTRADHILDVHEARQLLDAAKDSPYYALYVVAITGGLRQGELLALLWDNVDFTRRLVRIDATLAENRNGNLVRKEPKTKQSRRDVVVPTIAMEALHRHPRQSELVFTDSYGNPLRNRTSCGASFTHCCGKPGFPRYAFTVCGTALIVY